MLPMLPIRRLLVIAVVAAALPASGAAQDTHYWNLHYGTSSTLLSGAVIGSVSDLGATFYNPGALALFDNPEFILSARVYQYDMFTLEDGAGEGLDLASTSFDPAPSFSAGSFSFKWLKGHRLAYSVMTRQRMNIGVAVRAGTIRDVIPGIEGEETFGGEFLFDQSFNEIWHGLTWSFRIDSTLGLGVTQYLAQRNQQTRAQAIGQALTTTGEVAAALRIREFDFNHVRTLWKVGLGVYRPPLSAGVTITTPSVHLSGKGSALFNMTTTGLDVNGDGVEDPNYASNYQRGVRALYRSSWSFGVGAAYRVGRIRLHASAEWFDAVEAFDVLETEDFQAQHSGETLANDLTHELRAVVNYGIGLEVHLSDHFSSYSGFATDFSAAVPESETNLSLSVWDIYHMAVGTVVSIGSTELTLGATYAFGDEVLARPVDFTDPSEANQLIGSGKDATLIFRRVKFILGFSIEL